MPTPSAPNPPAGATPRAPGPVRPRGYTVNPDHPGTLVDLDSSHSSITPTIAPPAVSVVLPVYNESALIEHTLDAVLAFAHEHAEYEFIFVDDGSSDGTPDIIRRRLAAFEHAEATTSTVRLTAYTPNQGKGRAVKVGIGQSLGAMAIFTDSDLAYSLDHLLHLVEALATHDVVIGSRALVHRSERNTTVLRRITGWTFNKFARAILGLPYKDTQAGLKGFRAEAARRIFALEHLGGFAFDVEIVYLARRLGLSIGEIPAYVSEEHSYKVSKVSLVRDSMRMFTALIDVRLSALRGRYGR